jgi:hypothetical protein
MRGEIRNKNQFPVHELFNAKAGELCSIPGALNASERQLRKADIGIVDKDHACLDPTRHPLASLDI